MTCECSGCEPLIPNPSTEALDTGKRWPLENFDSEIFEFVVSGVAPAPGQSVDIAVPFFNLNVVDANFWLVYPVGYTFSMPVPHEGSGLSNAMANGRWTVYYESDAFSYSKFVVTASSESYNHSDGGLIWGIVKAVSI